MSDVIYAIGDLHGEKGLMDRMEDRLMALSRSIPANNPMVVTMGDYCDRGPESRAVLERLLDDGFAGMDWTQMPGNHDVFLTRAYHMFKKGSPGWESWANDTFVGALNTIKSFGVKTVLPERPSRDDLTRLMTSFTKNISPDIIQHIQTLPPLVSDGGIFFVHAGLNPESNANEQSFDDCINGVKGFFNDTMDFGYPVCVGHTTFQAPYLSRSKRIIGVDTGAHEVGVLTAGIFSDGRLFQFIAVCPEEGLSWTPIIVDCPNEPDDYLNVMRMWFKDVANASKETPYLVFDDEKRLQRFLTLTRIKSYRKLPRSKAARPLPGCRLIKICGVQPYITRT